MLFPPLLALPGVTRRCLIGPPGPGCAPSAPFRRPARLAIPHAIKIRHGYDPVAPDLLRPEAACGDELSDALVDDAEFASRLPGGEEGPKRPDATHPTGRSRLRDAELSLRTAPR